MFASSGSSIKFWDEKHLKVLQNLNDNSGIIPAISWNKDGQILAAFDQNTAEISLYTVDSKSAFCSRIFKVLESVTCLEFCKTNSRYLAIGDSKDQILIWDVKASNKKKSYTVPKSRITNLSFSSSDSHLAVGTVHGEAYTISNTNNLISRPIKIFSDKTEVKDIRFSILNRAIVGACGENGSVSVFDSNTNKIIARYKSHSAPVSNVVFSPINELLMISIGYDKKLVSYDTNSKSIVMKFEAEDPLTCISFIKNGQSVAVGTMTGQIITYDLRMLSHPLGKATAHKGQVHDLKFQPGFAVDKLKYSKRKSKNVSAVEDKVEDNFQDKFRSLKKAEESTSIQRTVSPERESTSFEILSPVNSRVSQDKELLKNVPLLKSMKTPARSVKQIKDFDEFELLSPLDKENRSPVGKAITSTKPVIIEGLLSPLEKSPFGNVSPPAKSSASDSVSKNEEIDYPQKTPPNIVDDLLLSPLKADSVTSKPSTPIANELPNSSEVGSLVKSSKNPFGSSTKKIKRNILNDFEKNSSTSAENSSSQFETSINQTEDQKLEEAIRLAFPSEEDGKSPLNVNISKISETEKEEEAVIRSQLLTGNQNLQHPLTTETLEELKSKYAFSDSKSELQSCISEALEIYDWKMRERMINVQFSFTRQIIDLKKEIKHYIRELSINEELLLENERLKDEISRLKCTY